MDYKNTTKGVNRQKESRPLHADSFRLFHFLSDYIKTSKPNELAMCCSLRQIFYDIAHTA